MDLMTLATLQGLIVSCQDIVDWSRFHLRPFQALLSSRVLDIVMLSPFQFHPVCIRTWGGGCRGTGCPRVELPQRVVVITEATLLGWGVHMQRSVTWDMV